MNFNYNEQEYEEFPNFKGGEKSHYSSGSPLEVMIGSHS